MQENAFLESNSDNNSQLHTKEQPTNEHILFRRGRLCPIENSIVLWLDSTIYKSDEDYQYSLTQFQGIVNSIESLTDADQCVDSITEVKDDKKIFMIVSDTFYQRIFPLIEGISQLHSVFVVSHQVKHQPWTKECNKVRGIFTDVEHICDALTRIIRQSEIDLMPISIISTIDSTSFDELDQSFMYSQLLKEIIFEINHDEKAKREFVHFCRVLYTGIDVQLSTIDRFDTDYELHSPIWWYTKESFIYSMINKGLRSLDIEIIIKMGFFMQQLHQQIRQLHSETNQTKQIIVYRGQGISNVDFEKIKKHRGGLLSFNNFLSTSTDRQVSLLFADSARHNNDLIGILFKMDIDPSLSSAPFASINNISYYSDLEEEILFSMHTVFRIGEIEEIEERLCEISLILTNDTDQKLKSLTDQMRSEIQGTIGWNRLGILMIKMGDFPKAVDIYEALLETIYNVDKEEGTTMLATIYNNIGASRESLGDHSSALSYYQKTLAIQQKYLPHMHPSLSTTYSNIAATNASIGDYPTALSYYQKTLVIQKNSIPSDHIDFATTYNNIGQIHQSNGKYSIALSYCQMALDIQQKSLPHIHPSLATTYNNIAFA